MPETPRTGVLFVCLGNICRSPLAEGIFTHLADQRGLLDELRIDSCGTGGWHAGEPPDPRAVLVAGNHGLDITHLRARKFNPRRDPAEFDWIIPMDRQNERDIIDLGTPADRVRLMRSFDPTLRAPADVPDPYYGGDDGFEKVYAMLTRACEGLLDEIAQRC